MKLKTKRLLAAALALSLTANISLAAFASTYYLDDGDISITGDDDGNAYVTQSDLYVKEPDNDITITQGGTNRTEDTETEDTEEPEENGAETEENGNSDSSGEDETAEDSTSDSDTTTSSITISGNVSNASITVENVNMVVDEDGSAAITFEDGTTAEVVLSGENDITLDAAGTSGIQVGTDGATEETNVTLTVEGTTTIDVSQNVLEKQVTDEAGYNTAGIAVGGGAVDAAGSGNANLTITGGDSEEGNANIIINNTSEGILVHGGSSLTIGEDEEHNDPIDITIDGSAITTDGGDGGSPVYSGAGRGLISYGTTIIKDGANLLVKNSADRGISVFTNDLQIKDGATVTVENSASDGVYAEQGAGIIVSGEDTSLTVDSSGSSGGSNGIAIESSETGDPALLVEEGAKVTVKNAPNAGISLGTDVDMTVQTGAEVTIQDGNDGITALGNNVISVLGESTTTRLNISNSSNTGITAYNADIYVKGNYAELVINDTQVYAIAWLGIHDDDDDETSNVLEVSNGGNLSITNANKGIYVVGDTATEAWNHTLNKTINILSGAKVAISGVTGQDIALAGGKTVLLVDDATLEASGKIASLNTSNDLALIQINNGARVVAGIITDYYGTSGQTKLYITGGTVELTGDGYKDPSRDLDVNDATTLLTTTFWPTSGKENGDELLTNFKLSVSALETLQADLWAEDEDLSEEEFFEKYGFLIEYEDGVPTTLTFQTYGVVDGEYYSYNENRDNGTESNWYVVDLTKDYGDALWVWTPAVVLSYFTLNADETLDDAESYDESTPWEPEDGVYDEDGNLIEDGVSTKLTDNHDVVVRGQSIAFGNFQTDKDYTTTNLAYDTAYDEAVATLGDNVLLYMYNPMDYTDEEYKAVNGDPLSGKTIIVQENDKYYLADADGNATDTLVGDYYYVLVDENGNFIVDDDGNYILADENGNLAYTDKNGNLVYDEKDSVLVAAGEYYYVVVNDSYALETTNEDGETVYVYTDEDGNPVTIRTEGAVRVEETVYYYAKTDDDGNTVYVDADGNELTEEQKATAECFAKAVYYFADTDDDGNVIYVDADGNQLSADAVTGKVVMVAKLDSDTYVLYDGEKYYLVNADGEATTLVNGEPVDLAGMWEVFDKYTRVRSNSQVATEGDTLYNFENAFGGVVTVQTTSGDPTVPEEPEIPSKPTKPTDPDETEEPDEPFVPVPVVPTDPSTPAQPETPAETPTETPAETPADPEAPAETPETPASSTPKTGDDSNVAIYLVMAALSGAALIGLGVTGKKKNEEV